MASKEEARNFVKDKIEYRVVVGILRNYLAKMIRVQQFLLTIVLRKRFKRKRAATLKLQGFIRICLAR